MQAAEQPTRTNTYQSLDGLTHSAAWSMLLKIALFVKRSNPQFRGHPPQGQGLRAQARAAGYMNHAHYAREMKEARDIVKHGEDAAIEAAAENVEAELNGLAYAQPT